jgi:ribosomal protein S18 acetylase RimI-like enzyme
MSHHANAARVEFRSAADTDRSTLEALVAQSCAATPFAAIPAYALRAAFERPTHESQVIVAERSGVVVGFVLFGDVAGAIGTARLHFIGVPVGERLRGIGSGACEAAMAQLLARGIRNVVAEMPDHPKLAGGRAFLTRCGFVEISRVADYYSDGVDLLILQRSAARM